MSCYEETFSLPLPTHYAASHAWDIYLVSFLAKAATGHRLKYAQSFRSRYSLIFKGTVQLLLAFEPYRAHIDQPLTTTFFFFGATAPHWARVSSFARFPDHTQRRTTVGRTPLYEWSARPRDLYLTTHNTHKNPCPPVVFEPTISAGERPQTYALGRATTGTGRIMLLGDQYAQGELLVINLMHTFFYCCTVHFW